MASQPQSSTANKIFLEIIVEKFRKGKGATQEMRRKSIESSSKELLEVADYTGDEKASIDRGLEVKAGLPYGTAHIKCEARIHITCNCDTSTIKKMNKNASKILKEAIEEELPFMLNFLEEVRREE